MTVDLVKDNGDWIVKSSDAGGTGGLTRGSGAGVAMPNVKDIWIFLWLLTRHLQVYGIISHEVMPHRSRHIQVI